MWQEREGSDHCPVLAEFELEVCCGDMEKQLPALCSRWFTGRQSKLSDFMMGGGGGGGTKEKGVVKEGMSGSRGAKGGGAKERGVRKEGVSGVKRSGTQDASSVPPTKNKKQKTLFSFASAPQATPPPPPPPPSDSSPALPQPRGGRLSEAWKGVFGGGAKPPLCSGHGEACVLKRVKKQGPNKDRQFWSCPCPGGAKDDPKASCNYFQWAKEKRKTQ